MDKLVFLRYLQSIARVLRLHVLLLPTIHHNYHVDAAPHLQESGLVQRLSSLLNVRTIMVIS